MLSPIYLIYIELAFPYFIYLFAYFIMENKYILQRLIIFASLFIINLIK